jgi:type IV pilus assembly protein PilX
MTTEGIGARYGQYTGAALGTSDKPANPILSDTSAADRGGWYWIEVLPYMDTKNFGLIAGSPNNLLSLNLKPNVVYRITALAYGRKPNTMVVLQQTYAQQKRKN